MNLALCALSVFFCGSVAFAENCPKYEPQDREAVRHIFTSQGSGMGFYVATGSGLTEILTRMANIAYLSSGTAAILSGSAQRGQRAALNAEYQALIRMIDEYGQDSTLPMKPRTRRFLRLIVNSENLGLSGTAVNGTDDQE